MKLKKISKLLILTTILIAFSCSNQEQEQSDTVSDSLLERNLTSSKQVFTCHSFTVGSSLLGISTTLHYCCVGDTLCGAPTTLGCVCGFVSDTTYEEIQTINNSNRNEESYSLSNKIHISELTENISLKYFSIDYSTSIKINDSEYMVKHKDYLIDKNGYISLELIKK